MRWLNNNSSAITSFMAIMIPLGSLNWFIISSSTKNQINTAFKELNNKNETRHNDLNDKNETRYNDINTHFLEIRNDLNVRVARIEENLED